MCCYKLVTVEFKWWGLQGKVEKFIHKVNERRENNLNVNDINFFYVQQSFYLIRTLRFGAVLVLFGWKY